MHNVLLLSMAAAMVLPLIATAQSTGALAGTVTLPDGKPAAGGTIKVQGTSPLRGAIIKRDGSFMVAGIRQGEYTVEVVMIGYPRLSRGKVRIWAGEETRLELRLAEARGSELSEYHPIRRPVSPFRVQRRTSEEMERSTRGSVFGAP